MAGDVVTPKSLFRFREAATCLALETPSRGTFTSNCPIGTPIHPGLFWMLIFDVGLQSLGTNVKLEAKATLVIHRPLEWVDKTLETLSLRAVCLPASCICN